MTALGTSTVNSGVGLIKCYVMTVVKIREINKMSGDPKEYETYL